MSYHKSMQKSPLPPEGHGYWDAVFEFGDVVRLVNIDEVMWDDDTPVLTTEWQFTYLDWCSLDARGAVLRMRTFNGVLPPWRRNWVKGVTRWRFPPGGVKGAWRRLCVMAEAGEVECFARVDNPLAAHKSVPSTALIHFHLFKNPEDANIGQVVLQGSDGRRLYDCVFRARRGVASSGMPSNQVAVINLYSGEVETIDYEKCKPGPLADKIVKWARERFPAWDGKSSSIRSRIIELRQDCRSR